MEYINIFTGAIVWAKEKDLGDTPGYAVKYHKDVADAMWYEK